MSDLEDAKEAYATGKTGEALTLLGNIIDMAGHLKCECVEEARIAHTLFDESVPLASRVGVASEREEATAVLKSWAPNSEFAVAVDLLTAAPVFKDIPFDVFKAAAEVVAITRRDVINTLVAEAMDLLFHCTHLLQQASGTAAEGGNTWARPLCRRPRR